MYNAEQNKLNLTCSTCFKLRIFEEENVIISTKQLKRKTETNCQHLLVTDLQGSTKLGVASPGHSKVWDSSAPHEGISLAPGC